MKNIRKHWPNAAALAAIPADPTKAQGIALGQAAAAAILDLRAADGAVGPVLNFNCPQATNPGEYQCTPDTPFIAFEVWANVTPFVLNLVTFGANPKALVTAVKREQCAAAKLLPYLSV